MYSTQLRKHYVTSTCSLGCPAIHETDLLNGLIRQNITSNYSCASNFLDFLANWPYTVTIDKSQKFDKT